MLKHHLRAGAERSAGAADRPRRPDGARLDANFKGWTETLRRSSGGDGAGAQWLLQNLYAARLAYCADRDFAKTIKARAWSSPAMTRRSVAISESCRS